jgi:site-specific DNA-cytosine methylase
MRVLELFAGIGGCATALDGIAEVRLAVDQDAAARATYALHHDHPRSPKNLHHVKVDWLAAVDAELWWMSPPCQPYTVRGRRRDLEDRRSQALVRIMEAIDAVGPPHVALENVPGFEGSDAETRLVSLLEAGGYDVHRGLLCPSALGVPASKTGLAPRRVLTLPRRPLRAWLDDEPDPTLAVPADLAARYDGAMHVVDPDDPLASAACFTGAYGRSPVYAGSYVRYRGGLRHLSPQEIASTLGFPRMSFPPDVGLAKRWKLVGNALSVYAVRTVLARLPTLAAPLEAAQRLT